MPTARRCVAAAAVNGIILVVGGGGLYDPVTDAVDAYDPKTDTWVAKAALSSPRSLVTLCELGGIIYAIGGFDRNSDAVATVEAYDPTTNQWTAKASLPEANWRGTADAVDGIIYAFFDRRTFAYDPASGGWTGKAPIPSGTLASGGSVSGVVDGFVYLFGGLSDNDSTSYPFSLAYDPVRDRFTSKRLMPVTCEDAKCDSRRAYAACATIDGKIYIAGGIKANPNVETDAIDLSSTLMFDPHGGMAPQLQSVTHESADHVRLVWQGEAGRLYGVESAPDLAQGLWSRFMFSTDTSCILATNALVEATCTVPAADTARFFRVLEAD
ncbi:MAG: Kelch repeat-containing protein [Verrucomicrobiia bacterium]